MFSKLLPVLVSATAVAAQIKGFNYGATMPDGSFTSQDDFKQLFTAAQTLVGAPGFTSARLYTMIAGGTTNTPTGAIQAAIDTKTTLLLGLWASGGADTFNNELAALTSAITQYGTNFTDIVDGISVGSEDLYRISPTGIENKSGAGAQPDELVGYINQLRAAVKSSGLSTKPVGHVDTWTAWVNGSNNAVISAVDFLGLDAYPYFQSTESNSIQNAQGEWLDSLKATQGVAAGKQVWVTETGWPLGGPTQNLAIPGVDNAKTYWDEVGCCLFGHTNTWWYTIFDGSSSDTRPSFGLVGSTLSNKPQFDLTCPASPVCVSKTSASTNSTSTNGTGSSNSTLSGSGNGSGSGSGPQSSGSSTAGSGSGSTSAASHLRANPLLRLISQLVLRPLGLAANRR